MDVEAFLTGVLDRVLHVNLRCPVVARIILKTFLLLTVANVLVADQCCE